MDQGHGALYQNARIRIPNLCCRNVNKKKGKESKVLGTYHGCKTFLVSVSSVDEVNRVDLLTFRLIECEGWLITANAGQRRFDGSGQR